MEITDHGIEILNCWLNTASEHPLHKALLAFKKEGGLIKRVWGIERDSQGYLTFQNAIQIGDYILDIARDTGRTSSMAKVSLHTTATTPLSCSLSFVELGKTYQEYWRCKIFSTREILPNVAHIVPFVAAGAEAFVQFPSYHGATIRNALLAGREAADYTRALPLLPAAEVRRFNNAFARIRNLFDGPNIYSLTRHTGLYEIVVREEAQQAKLVSSNHLEQRLHRIVSGHLSVSSFFDRFNSCLASS
jgi:hypothetical protein